MSDPLTPPLESLTWNEAELATIAAAMAEEDPWAVKSDEIKAIKQRLQKLHLERQLENCCYCKISLKGGGHFMIDREHILPKSKYPEHVFAVWNISVACKRCNMQFKGTGDCFVKNKADAAALMTSANYEIVHPNYDDWHDHLDLETHRKGKIKLIAYFVLDDSEKGKRTFDYFDLKSLQEGQMDAAQGILPPSDITEGGAEARTLAKQFGQ